MGENNLLQQLKDKLATLSPEEALKAKGKIGGKTQVDTLNALLNSLGEDGMFEKIDKALENTDNALNDMASTMQNNLTGQLTRMKSA